MPVYIEMPKLSDTMTEGIIVRWLKQEGESVTAGDVIAEVETDKATMEMEAFDDGKLFKVFAKDGVKAAVGSKIAVLIEEGEEPPSEEELATASAEISAAPTEKPVADIPTEPAPVATKAAAPEKTTSPVPKGKKARPTKSANLPAERVKASPLARKIADDHGIGLAAITGSGPGGRITADDVRNAPAGTSATASSLASFTPSNPDAPAPGTERRVEISTMRKVIAQRLLESKTQNPHFYLTVEIDAAPLLKLRAEVKEAGEPMGLDKVTINDFVLRATALAAAKVPAVNASFAGDAIIEYGSVNISVAVAIDDGLITPVIFDAQSKGVREISVAMKDLATRARTKKLAPNEYQGGTITVSNLGAFGVDSFYAIINPPQSAILAIGGIVKKPVVNANDEIVIGHRMNIGLSGDHRVVDGSVGAAFLAEFKTLLERPSLLLV